MVYAEKLLICKCFHQSTPMKYVLVTFCIGFYQLVFFCVPPGSTRDHVMMEALTPWIFLWGNTLGMSVNAQSMLSNAQ